MADTDRAPEELYAEIEALRAQVAKLETAAIERARIERLYSKAFHSSPAATTLSTLNDGRFIEVNESFLDIFGFARDELIGRTAIELGIWLNVREREPLLRQLSEHGSIRNIEIPARTKSGEIRDMLGSLEVLSLNGDKLLLSIFSDITKRKRAEEVMRESEESMRQLIEGIPVPMLISTPDNEVEYVNARFAELFGYTLQDIPTIDHWDELAYPDTTYRKQVVTNWTQAMDTVGDLSLGIEPQEARVTCKDGSSRIIEFQFLGIGSRNLMAGHDITERKRAEEALRESEGHFRTLMEQSTLAIEVYSTEGVLLQVNKASETLWGSRMKQDIGTFNLLDEPQASDTGIRPYFESALAGEGQLLPEKEYDPQMIGLPGRARSLRTHLYPLKGPGGEVRSIVAMHEDITERRQTAEALRESEEKYRSLTTRLPIGVYRTDRDGRILFANPALVKLLGYDSVEELTTETTASERYVDPRGREEHFKQWVAQGGIGQDEELLLRKDGTQIWVRDVGRIVLGEEGEVEYTEGTLEDITERKQATENLEASEKRYRSLVDNALVGVYRTNLKGDILYVNEALPSMHGFASPEEMMQEGVLARYKNLKDRERLIGLLRESGSVADFEFEVLGKQDNTISLLMSATLEGDVISGMIMDITGRKQAQELIHTQRDLAMKLNAALGLEETLRLCTEAAIQVTGLDGGIYLVDERTGDLHLAYSQGLSDDFVRSVSFIEADDPRAHIVKAGKPVYTLHQEQGIPLDEQLRHEGFRALAAVPVIHEGEVIACLNLASHTRHDISEYARQALETIASQIGSAVARVRAAEALRESERKYRTLFENMTAGFALHEMVYDEQGQPADYRYLEINPAFEKLTGVPVSSLLGKTVKEVLPGTEQYWIDVSGKVAQTGEPIAYQNYSKELGRYYDTWLFSPARDQFAVVFTDATERVQAEEEIRRRNRELGALNDIAAVVSQSLDLDEILNAALDKVIELVQVDAGGIYLVDVERPKIDLVTRRGVSERYAEEVGSITVDKKAVQAATAQGKVGRFILSLEAILRNQAELRRIRSAMQREGLRLDSTVPVLLQAREEIVGLMTVTSRESRRYTEAELQLLTSIGQQLAVAIQNAQLYEQIQQHAGELERRVAERTADLEAAYQELESLSEVKDEFVSNVSHELRTPITTIKVHQGLLEMDPDGLAKSLPVLQRETERLSDTIEDLLRLSRLDQDRVALQLAAVDLNTLASQYVADRQPLAEGKGLTLTFAGQEDLPSIQADEGLLGQVLSILLTNALNYTPSGGSVAISTQSREEGGQSWTGFSVSDTGPGILPKEQRQVFERFVRGKVGRESGEPGTGLGLPLAREIVERHRGQIELASESIPGQGATFSVWLPVEGGTHG